MTARVWRAWVVDDSSVDSKATSGALGALGYEVDAVRTEQEFLNKFEDAVGRKVYPDLIVLDLRLNWSGFEQRTADALTDGLSCMRTIEGEPGFANTAIVIYSAFVKNELVVSRLREFHFSDIIDKRDKEHLPVVVSNLFPSALQSPKARALRMMRWMEASVNRVWLFVGGVIGLAVAILWLWNSFR